MRIWHHIKKEKKKLKIKCKDWMKIVIFVGKIWIWIGIIGCVHQNIEIESSLSNSNRFIETSMVEFFERVQYYVSMSHVLCQHTSMVFFTLACSHSLSLSARLFCLLISIFIIVFLLSFLFCKIFLRNSFWSVPIWAHFIKINYHSEYYV